MQDPTYLAWNYTVRSSDGHVAQHLDANDVGWHAGNWYVNMHSIGIEHEGYAADGATWFTESMYESSAALVTYLAHEYDIPLDRAHIIGHDQVPGILPKYVRGMHWDPGPYWDWNHYFYLLGAPLGRGIRATPTNVQGGLLGREGGAGLRGKPAQGHRMQRRPEFAAPDQGSNFVYLRTAPRAKAPLVKDVGLHRHGFSTTDVADVGARADAGQKFVVADTSGSWIAVWYLGEKGWIYIPPGHSPLVRSSGTRVLATGVSAPVYGRAYPERGAYPETIPYQRVGSAAVCDRRRTASTVLADDHVATDYYYATTYNDSVPDDHTRRGEGKDPYYEIWFGHVGCCIRPSRRRDQAVAAPDGTPDALHGVFAGPSAVRGT